MSQTDTIITVHYVSATIIGSDNTELGTFGVSQLATSFSVENIPTCTLTISDGTDFSSPVQSKSVISDIINKHSTDNLHITVKMGLSLNTDGAAVISNHEEILFNGVISGMSIVYNYVAAGRSYYGVTIHAIHRFADLYKFGSAGMIYAAADTINDSQLAEHLIRQSSAKARASKSSSSSAYSSNLVSQALGSCLPSGSSSSTRFASIVEAMVTMSNIMYKAGAIVPDNTDPKLDTYIKGTLKPTVKSKYVNDMYRFILHSLHSSVSKGNLADGIIASCIREYGFYIAPRSTDYVTILPMSYTSVSPKDTPVIGLDRYQSLTYNPKSDIGTNIQGVLVTYAGSNTNKTEGYNSLVRGRFPDNTGKEAVRWACIPSPGWFNGASVLYGNTQDKDGTNTTDSKEYIKELCDAYAADRFQYLKYRNNLLNLTVDIRSVRAYTALGASFDIEYPKDPSSKSANNPFKIRATLESYSFQYKSTEDSSGVNINLSFRNARPSSVDVLESPKLLLYSIGEEDIIKEFPDISKQKPTGGA